MASPSDIQVIQRLSQYRPFERGGASSREAQEDLVLTALAEQGGACPSIEGCRDCIATLFGIDLDRVEVARCLDALGKQGFVTTSDGEFRLSDAEKLKLEATALNSQNIKQKAMDEWHRFLTTQWPRLTDDDLSRLSDELDLYLRTVLRRHGAESALLLYPNESRAADLFAQLEEEGFDFLPPAPKHIAVIRDNAFSSLLRQPSENQKRFLDRMLNAAYFLTVLSIDPAAAMLVREAASGQKVYLDTNFLYRLLGIQGPRFILPAQTVLKRTQDAGYNVFVTPWTVAEFKKSLERSSDYLSKYPVPPADYAALAADATSEDDFVTAYWRKVRAEPGLKPEDFIALYSELQPHLSEYDVTVDEEGCKAVEQDTAGVDADIGLLERALDGKPRGVERLRHDARHRLLVLRLRGNSNRTFATAGCWFLTHDSLLPRYDYIARGGKSPDPPFCVSVSAWFQVIEAFRPKSEDLDQSFADLLASPYVRYRNGLSKESAQAISARIALYKDASPQLAAKLFMNSFLMHEIDGETDQDAAVKKIDSAIVAAAKEAQEEAELAAARADAAQRHAHTVEEEAEERVSLIEAERERSLDVERTNKERALADERERKERALADERERKERALADERERAKGEIQIRDQSLRTRDAELTKLKHRVTLGMLVVIGCAIFAAGALVIGVHDAWVFLGGAAVIASVIAAADQFISKSD